MYHEKMGIQRFKIHRQAMPVARQLLKRQRRQAYKPSCPASPGLAGNIQACPGNKQGLPRPSIAHTSPSNFCLRNGKAQAHASAARCYQLIMQFFELTSTFFSSSFFSYNSLLWFFSSEKQNLLCQSAIIVIIDLPHLLLVLKGVFLKNSDGKK